MVLQGLKDKRVKPRLGLYRETLEDAVVHGQAWGALAIRTGLQAQAPRKLQGRCKATREGRVPAGQGWRDQCPDVWLCACSPRFHAL